MLSTNRVLSGIFRKGLSSVARYAIIIIILALASPCLISCKKTMDLVEAKPHVSELVVVQAHGKKMAADIDISDLLAVWKNNLPTTEAPQFQDPYEASCRIVHEFSKAGKTAGFLSPGS